MTTAVRVDSKGRILLPRKDRELLGIGPGDLLFLKRERAEFRLIRVEDPFDALAAEAIREHREGKTVSLRDFARVRDIDLDAEDDE